MKNILITLTLLLAALCGAAQSFEKGDVMVSPGFGLGLYGVGYGLGFAVPLTINVDIGVSDYLSAGGYASYWGKTWEYSFTDKYKFRSTHLGVRGTAHWGKYLEDKLELGLVPDNVDLYATGWLGYNVRSAKWVTDDANLNNINQISWGNRVQGGAQIGVRYFPKENLGFFAEWGGTPTAYSNWGLTFKF